MNGIDLGRGRSFKKLSQYLLHDAKDEEGQHQTSTERVGWTQTHNLNDAPADKAWRLMVATAKSADALKAAADISNRGAKCTKPVYHYTITWPEADKASDQLQKKAVAESLKALGLENHQSLVVQHKDSQAPHIHVMVNLIDPENGTTAKLSYTHKKLRTMANKFEMKHGLQVTEASHNNIERRREGERVDAQRKPRNVYEQEKREGNDRRLAWLRKREDTIARDLQKENVFLKKQHATEWAALKESYYTRRDALHVDKDVAEHEAVANVKATYKPKWAAVFKTGRERMKQFEKSERSALLQIFTATTTFMEHRKAGTGILKSLAAASNQAERRAVIEKWNKQDEDRLGREVRAEIAAAVRAAREGHDVKITDARTTFLKQCNELKETQDKIQDGQRKKWRQYKEGRKKAFDKMRTGSDAMQLLENNESLSRYVGRRLEP